jgi:hypothetical protein
MVAAAAADAAAAAAATSIVKHLYYEYGTYLFLWIIVMLMRCPPLPPLRPHHGSLVTSLKSIAKVALSDYTYHWSHKLLSYGYSIILWYWLDATTTTFCRVMVKRVRHYGQYYVPAPS